MAVTVNSIQAITKRYFFPKVVDQIQDSMALLMKLKSAGRMTNIDGGDQIYVPVSYARNTSVMNYAGDQTLNVSAQEKRTALVFDWKQKSAPITISGIDKIKNAGAAKVVDHVAHETECAKRDLKDSFATGIYSAGTDSLEIDGVRTFLSTTATYGGISQSTESWLQARIDATTTATSLGKMQEMWELCKIDDDRTDLITTTATLFNAYWSLLQPQQRFSDSKLASGGFLNLAFNTASVVEDSYAPSGMFFFNTSHLKLVSSSQRPFPGELQDAVKPTNQDAYVQLILWAGNLICDEPRKEGWMSALTS